MEFSSFNRFYFFHVLAVVLMLTITILSLIKLSIEIKKKHNTKKNNKHYTYYACCIR